MDTSEILHAFPIKEALATVPLKTGLIHATYLVKTAEGDFILQRVSDIFSDAVFEDLENVTNHLRDEGITTFSLVRTKSGERFHKHAGRWRLMTVLPGAPLSGTPSLAELTSAGKLVGAFHAALADYPYDIRHRIPDFHDTPAYMRKLRELDERENGSEKHASLHQPAQEILAGYEALPAYLAHLPLRVLHGDPKLENVLFNEKSGEALALIDLDTVGRYPLTIEVGDMLRSWCKSEGSFSVEAWEAALAGYRMTASFVTPEEWKALPDGLVQVTLELSARFVIDAYEERYFAHDPARYPSLYEENLARAQHALGFLKDFDAKRHVLEA